MSFKERMPELLWRKHPVVYPLCTASYPPRVKQARRESDLRLHLVSMLNMLQVYLHSPYVFMVWYLIKYMENFIFFVFYF
jgi:hypothetical protein